MGWCTPLECPLGHGGRCGHRRVLTAHSDSALPGSLLPPSPPTGPWSRLWTLGISTHKTYVDYRLFLGLSSGNVERIDSESENIWKKTNGAGMYYSLPTQQCSFIQLRSYRQLTRNCHVITDPCYGEDPVIVAVLKNKWLLCKSKNNKSYTTLCASR